MYPGGKAVTVDCEFLPIRVSRNGQIDTVVMVKGTPVGGDTAGQMEVNRSHEMLRHTPTGTLLFTTEGEHIQSNVNARAYYYGSNQDAEHRHVKDRELTLRDVIATCMWPKDDDEVCPVTKACAVLCMYNMLCAYWKLCTRKIHVCLWGSMRYWERKLLMCAKAPACLYTRHPTPKRDRLSSNVQGPAETLLHVP
jgi:hypothetical protein